MEYQLVIDNEFMLVRYGMSQNHGRSAAAVKGGADLKACTDKIKAMIEGLSA
jgi:hypothetical protein